ncbi:hypothetical protein F9L33_04840 [Amylibacter sp. SFDW26]|uniref:hypothetical protein n=1 Tax=Amylibacter sp. SFDW26 TaxID=2652722 RepID=UPI0012625B48|nr:hypothetical protein [Amylibacter sp. SFDW26]KAB7616092.1 hypothetical protein F9L33_04840 [Amylibacter sp. SFDW26]
MQTIISIIAIVFGVISLGLSCVWVFLVLGPFEKAFGIYKTTYMFFSIFFAAIAAIIIKLIT